jgi:hypothetical protein
MPKKSDLQLQGFAAISKVNVFAAGVSAGFTAYDTGHNIEEVIVKCFIYGILKRSLKIH